MNRVGHIQKSLLVVGIMLIGTVGYVALNPDNEDPDSAQNHNGELIAELVKMESRLQQQIADLKHSPADSRQSTFGHNEYAGELERLNRQLSLMIEKQEDYEKRFHDIEMRLSQMAMTSDVELASARDINVLNAAPVGFKTQQHEPVMDNNDYPSQDHDMQLYAIQQQIDTYDRKLFEEEPDPQWSSTIKTRIIKVIQETAQLSGVHVQQSQCGTSLCKLDVYVEEGESVEEKVQMLMVNRPWQGESFVSFEFDGNGAIFFARDGEMLP